MIKVAYAVLDRIKNTSSRIEKSNIIEEFKDDDFIKKVLFFLFNDFVVTGLATKKISKKVEVKPDTVIGNLVEAMDYLQKNNTGSDLDIANIQDYINRNCESEEERQFLYELFTKTYTAGVTAKTINQVFGYDFIPVFDVQLAHSFKDHADKVNEDFTITLKLDGHRTIVAVDDFGNPSYLTRKGKPILGLSEITKDIKQFCEDTSILSMSIFNKGFVLDGEATAKSSDFENVFKDTSKIIRKDGEKTGLQYNVFDIVPIDEFYSGESIKKYNERRLLLNSLFSKNYDNLKLVETLYQGSDRDAINSMLKTVTQSGGEGVMINLNTPYYTKRNTGLLKVKEMNTMDLPVLEVYEGTGKNKGRLGGLYVDFKGNKVGVGSGFTDEQRDTFFKNKDEIVGKIVEVQYFEVTSDSETGLESLRFPVFIQIREDKTLEDVSYD